MEHERRVEGMQMYYTSSSGRYIFGKLVAQDVEGSIKLWASGCGFWRKGSGRVCVVCVAVFIALRPASSASGPAQPQTACAPAAAAAAVSRGRRRLFDARGCSQLSSAKCVCAFVSPSARQTTFCQGLTILNGR